MTEFTELDLSKDVNDLTEAEAKETLSEFVSEHRSNEEAYDELQSEYEEKLEEREERIDELEGRVDEWREERAEKAAEFVKMPADLLADRFSIEELEQIIEEGSEHSEAGEVEEEEEEEQSLTTFTEKPEKGKEETPDFSEEARDRAEQRLAERGFPVN